MGKQMLNTIIGTVIGFCSGVALMCIMVVAKESDEEMKLIDLINRLDEIKDEQVENWRGCYNGEISKAEMERELEQFIESIVPAIIMLLNFPNLKE